MSTNQELFNSVIQAGQTALKSSLLINGGAAVALLAYLGKVSGTLPLSQIAFSLILFLCGVLSAAVATGTTYLTQCFFYRKNERVAHIFNGLSIALVIFSYLCFGLGTYKAFIWFSTA